MNVSEIARKLKITPQELLDILPQMGFDIGKRAIKVPDYQVDRIIQAYQQYRRRRQMEEEERYYEEMKAKRLAELGASGGVKLPETVTVRQLSEVLGLPVAKVISEMMRNGIMATINKSIDFETASIIAADLGYAVERETAASRSAADQDAARMRLMELVGDPSKNAPIRPPVVVIMGHVDHGKTTLLDAIRHANVAAGESGGITQHIGAYQVAVPYGAKNETRYITFLDTPGHEAFSAMRSRGGRVADIAVLVIAADDGVQPQTIESLEIIQKEGLPFIVAINKIDKPDANVLRAKKMLSELNVVPEEYGGNVVVVPLSAKTREGIDTLLEMILLQADLKNICADKDRPGVGIVIESHVSRDEGAVATVIVLAGTLRLGDTVVAGGVPGKVRQLRDDYGKSLSEVGPGTPAQILGMRGTPTVGESFQVLEDKKAIKEIIKEYELHAMKDKQLATSEVANTEIPVVLTADVAGSLEAIETALSKISIGGRGRVRVVKKSIGAVTEADVLEAAAQDAVVLAFKSPVKPEIESIAKEKNIHIGQFEVIYALLEEAEKLMKEKVAPETVRQDIGSAKVLAIFRQGAKDMIVGVKVNSGFLRPSTFARVMRKGEFVTRVSVKTVQLGKEVVGEMAQGAECGIKVVGEPLIQVGDILEIFSEVKE